MRTHFVTYGAVVRAYDVCNDASQVAHRDAGCDIRAHKRALTCVQTPPAHSIAMGLVRDSGPNEPGPVPKHAEHNKCGRRIGSTTKTYRLPLSAPAAGPKRQSERSICRPKTQARGGC